MVAAPPRRGLDGFHGGAEAWAHCAVLAGFSVGRSADAVQAADLLQHAYALACHLADPCWEALAQHGLAMVDLGDGDVRAAIVRLQDARQRCRRHPDTYRWVTAHVLDALCGIGVAHRMPDTATWVGELEALALGVGLRDQIVRVYRHRASLGEPAAAAAAELLARDTDNPALLT